MKSLWTRHLLVVLSFIVPFLIMGFGWKFYLFKQNYLALHIYRNDIYAPFALGSLLVQAILWAFITYKYLPRNNFPKLFLTLFLLSSSFGISYAVFTIGAKHVMSSVIDFAILETPFILITHLIISILTAAVYTIGNNSILNNEI